MITKSIPSALGVACVLGLGLLAPVAAAAAPNQACVQIRSACESAGFAPGAAREGAGLWVDCIRPVVQGTPPRRSATKPLPQVDAQLVAQCKAANPGFGQPKAAKSTPAPQAPAGK